MFGSTTGGFSVPCCWDSLSLRGVFRGVPGVRSAGAICSGGGCDALGGASCGCVCCGGAGCRFCAPTAHGNVMQASRENNSLIWCFIPPERRHPHHVPRSHGRDAQPTFPGVKRMLLRTAVWVLDVHAAIGFVDGAYGCSCARASRIGRSATRLLAVGPNSASSRAVSIGRCRTVGASGAKRVCQPAMSRRQYAMAAWLVLPPVATL